MKCAALKTPVGACVNAHAQISRSAKAIGPFKQALVRGLSCTAIIGTSDSGAMAAKHGPEKHHMAPTQSSIMPENALLQRLGPDIASTLGRAGTHEGKA